MKTDPLHLHPNIIAFICILSSHQSFPVSIPVIIPFAPLFHCLFLCVCVDSGSSETATITISTKPVDKRDT